MLDSRNEIRHLGDRAHAQEWHAAMRDSPQRRDFEPVNPAMPETDSVYIQRLGQDDEVGAIAADVPALGEIRHARKAATFFIHCSALFDRAVELHSTPAD